MYTKDKELLEALRLADLLIRLSDHASHKHVKEMRELGQKTITDALDLHKRGGSPTFPPREFMGTKKNAPS